MSDGKVDEQTIEQSKLAVDFFSKLSESFAYCKIIIEAAGNSKDAFYVDATGNAIDFIYLDVNPAFEKLIGKTGANIVGKRNSELYPTSKNDPDEQNMVRSYVNVALTGNPSKFERYSKYADKWVNVSVYSPKKGYFVVLSEDITERKKAEEAVKQNDNRIKEILNSLQEAIYALDQNWNIVYTNNSTIMEQGAKAVGLKNAQDLVGKNWLKIFPGYQGTAFLEHLRTAMKEKKTRQFEYFGQYSKRWADVSIYPSLNGIVVSGKDITERKKAEEALKESEERFSKAFFDSPQAMTIADLDGRIVEANEQYSKLFGFSHDELVGHTISELVTIGNTNTREKHRKQLQSGKGSLEGEQFYILPTGKTINTLYSAQTVSIKGKPHILTTIQNVTERKKAEEALKQNEQTFLELIERSPFGIYVVNSQFCIQYMNKGSQDAAFRNVRPVIGRNFSEAMHILWPEPTASEILSHFRHTLETGEPYYSPKFIHPRHDVEIIESYEWELQRIRLLDGQYGVICYYFDSTKLRDAERGLSEAQAKLKEYATNLERLVEERTKQLKDAERLAAIGATAGMVGHDIRNPLQAIVSDVFLIKFDMSAIPDIEQKEGIQESLDSIEKNINYINKIVQDLQDFSKAINPVAKEVDLSILCENILKSSNVPTNIEATCKVEKNANVVMADEELLRRVVGNLAINAVQAMPNGGKLDIHAYKQEKDTIIEVKDTGMGIPEEVKPRLFTPLFTTKSKGQGFGLAVVKRVTESMNGTITFESQEGKGTKFILRFPPPQKE